MLCRSLSFSSSCLLPRRLNCTLGGSADSSTLPQLLAISGEKRRCPGWWWCWRSGSFQSSSSLIRPPQDRQFPFTSGGEFDARFNQVAASICVRSRRGRSRSSFLIASGRGANRASEAGVHVLRGASSTTAGAAAAAAGSDMQGTETSDEYLVGGRYCVLLTGHAPDYSQKLYGGYGQMFIKLLGDPQDSWDIYSVVDGQFPADEDLDKYNGFVVTGSKHNAHDNDDWILKLCTLLQSLHEQKRTTLGVCFGHQVLSRALGGKTGKSEMGWEAGLRRIQTTEALAVKSYAVGLPPSFRILEVHQDQVQEVPPGGELLGFSERTGIELFAVGEHALGIQGHPEFTEDVVTDIIDSRHALGIMKDDEAKMARDSLKDEQPDQEALLRLCKGFLKRRT